MQAMSMEEQAQAVEMAMQGVRGQILLMEDDHSKIWLKNGQLLRHTPGASRGWICRKLNVRQLIKVTPAVRVLQVLGETS